MYRGTTRQRTMSITVDGALVRTWESSGTTDDFEVVDLTGNDGGLLGNLASFGVSGRVVQIAGELGPDEWLSIVEVGLCQLFTYIITMYFFLHPPTNSARCPSLSPRGAR